MRPLDIYLYIILVVHLTTCVAAPIWLHRYMKKKYPDKKNGR
ncbi:hypothetical protein SAMN05192549_107197 [Duganella sacchari]|uniref:Uncharacterized protein n=1 Tax=Duganella sacchari TaxID=551987 RepID=A0A1M7QKT6_9BURK|nr:hypothetical protein SAMN05192549_107197 [Duganella sacchari]